MREGQVELGQSAGSGVSLSVLSAGPVAGKPIMLVHGFAAAKEDFADWLDRLGSLGWHAVAPDLRGHGSSSKPDDLGAYGLRTMAADLLALADALGWDRFTLLGHSMGGMVVQFVAIEAGDRLDALVLMDTSHGALGDDVPPELIQLAKDVIGEGGMQAYLEVSKTIEGPLDTPAYRRMVAERPDYAAYGDRKTLAASPSMWVGMVDELTSTEIVPDRLSALAAAVRVPTLVLVGEQDRPFLPHSQRMAAAIPGARLVVLPGGGHSPQFEAPDAWWAALSEFLAEVALDRASAGGYGEPTP